MRQVTARRIAPHLGRHPHDSGLVWQTSQRQAALAGPRPDRQAAVPVQTASGRRLAARRGRRRRGRGGRSGGPRTWGGGAATAFRANLGSEDGISALLVGLAWLAGTGLQLGREAGPMPLWPAMLALAASLVAAGGSRLSRVALLAGVVCLGAWRGGLAPSVEGGPLTALRGQVVTLTGVVAEPPRCSPGGCLTTLRVDRVSIGRRSEPVEASVQLRTGRERAPEVGSAVTARGELRAPRPALGWPRVELLARRGIYEVLDYPRLSPALVAGPPESSRLEQARLGLERRLVGAVGGLEGQLAAGLLLGREVQLPAEIRDQLRVTGTSHIVAVSGFNVALVGGAVLALSVQLLSRRWALLAASGAVLAYVGLVGAPPSAVRAGLMFGAASLAAAVGRLPDPLSGLALAAAGMAAVEPALLLDLGFQLSFAATAGLVLLAGRLLPAGRWLPAWLGAAVASVLAVQVAILPLLLYHFRMLALVAPAVNLALAPLTPLTMASAALALLGADLPLVGNLLGGLTWWLAHAMLATIDWAARLPLATLGTGRPRLEAVGAAYLLLVGPLVLAASWRAGPPGLVRALPALGAVGSLVGLLLVGQAAAASDEAGERLRVRFFDVAGDGLSLVETGGRRVLVGAAGSPLALAALSDQLPFLDRRFDLLVLSRAGPTDLLGLSELVQRYPVGLVLQPPPTPGAAADGWLAALDRAAVRRLGAEPGLSIDLGDGVTLRVDGLTAEAERAPALDARLVADGLEVLFVGRGPPEARSGGDWRVLRLAPELSIRSFPALARTGPDERTVVVGGRAGSDRADGGAWLPLGAAEVVELRLGADGLVLRRQPCLQPSGRCQWP